MKFTLPLQPSFTVPNYHQQLSAARPIQVYTYVFEGSSSGMASAAVLPEPPIGGVHRFSGIDALPPHDHEHHEFALVTSGSAIHRSSGDEQPIGRGAVFAVAPHDVHAFDNPDRLVMVNCTYLTEYLFYDIGEVLSVQSLAPLFFHEAISGGGLRFRMPQWFLPEPQLTSCLRELRDIADERARPDASPVFMRRTLEKLMLLLHRSFIESGEKIHQPVEQGMRAVLESIEEEIAAGAALDIEGLARSMGMTQPQFAKAFRSATGRAPTDYYQHRRVQQACCLLLDSRRDVTGVAHELGYYDGAHFSRLFKRYRGIGPKAFQKRYLDNGSADEDA